MAELEHFADCIEPRQWQRANRGHATAQSNSHQPISYCLQRKWEKNVVESSCRKTAEEPNRMQSRSRQKRIRWRFTCSSANINVCRTALTFGALSLSLSLSLVSQLLYRSSYSFYDILSARNLLPNPYMHRFISFAWFSRSGSALALASRPSHSSLYACTGVLCRGLCCVLAAWTFCARYSPRSHIELPGPTALAQHSNNKKRLYFRVITLIVFY